MFTEFDPLDPDETDNFTFGFSNWLDPGEVFTGISFPDFPTDLNLVSSTSTADDVTARISVSAALPESSYNVTCRITTNGGRIKDLTGNIPIADA